MSNLNIKWKGKVPVLAVLKTVTIDQTYDIPIAIMAVDEVIYLKRKIDEAPYTNYFTCLHHNRIHQQDKIE